MLDSDLKSYSSRSSDIKFFENFLVVSIFLIHASFGIIPAETTPIPLLIVFYLFHLRSGFDRNLIILSIFLLFSSSFSLMQGISFMDVFEQLSVYLQILFMGYYVIKFGLQNISIKLLYLIIFFHIIVGFSQFFEISIINNAVSILIPRTETLIDNISGRGVPFLATEPSEALQYILLPLFLLSLKNKNSNFNSSLIFFTVLITTLLSTSGTSFLTFFIFFIFIIYFLLKPFKFILLSAFIAVFLLNFDFLNFLNLFDSDNRALSIAIQILSTDPYYLVDLVSQISGFRFALDYASFTSFFYFQPAYGVGSWTVNSLYSLSQSGIDINYFADFMYLDIVPLKPVSVPGILILEFGLVGLLFVIFLIIKSYRFILIFFKSLNFNNLSKTLLIVAILKIFFLVIVGNPSSIAIIALSIFLVTKKKAEQ